jgi:hypothetical protein
MINSIHKNCLVAKGIKFITCIECGKTEFNYVNGVSLCSKCRDKKQLCPICGREVGEENCL